MKGEPNELPPISAALWRGFCWYGKRYVRRHFHAIRLSRASPAPKLAADEPAIIYLNHPSWWDPMTCLVLADAQFPGRRHYAPIDAQMLERYGIFKRLGFFGVEPGTARGACTFLRVGRAVCNRRGAMLWVTAQGRFTDVRTRPVTLRPGLAHLLRRASGAAVIPLAIEYAFWEERSPEILLRFGPVIRSSAGMRASDLNTLLESQLTAAQDALAEESQSRDPARFHSILSGEAGVGGVYDRWRSLKARLAGRTFVSEHGTGGAS